MIIKYAWNRQSELKSFRNVNTLQEIIDWLNQKYRENWYCNENGDYSSFVTQIHIILEPKSNLWIILHPTIQAYYLMAGDNRIGTFFYFKSILMFLKFLEGF